VAHEVGHYAQKLTGTFQKKEAARGRVVQAENNRASVHMIACSRNSAATGAAWMPAAIKWWRL